MQPSERFAQSDITKFHPRQLQFEQPTGEYLFFEFCHSGLRASVAGIDAERQAVTVRRRDEVFPQHGGQAASVEGIRLFRGRHGASPAGEKDRQAGEKKADWKLRVFHRDIQWTIQRFRRA
ncbi:MAG: hypothetical protein ABIP85_25735 [Chthoniobacteraceae bacterium]